ncbi:MAG: VWA domain-containing protein [Pseudomonadales bacterium]
MFSLEIPWIFALLPLPLAVIFLLPKAAQQDAALRVPAIEQWMDAGESQGSHASLRWLSAIALTLIWLCLLIAAARPLWQGAPVSQQTSGRDLMIAVDISHSMSQSDMILRGRAVDRLSAVKAVVGEFVERRNGDRLGLILFGSETHLHVPLTFDLPTLRTLIEETQIGFAGKRTAIGDAIGMAVKHLKDEPSDSRVLILLTDGTNTAGQLNPIQAAQLAAKIDLKIYTIGVGAKERTMSGAFGSFGRSSRASGADFNETELEKIAKITGGQYFRAQDTRTLEEIYGLLDQLEPGSEEAVTFRPKVSLAHWPLAIALALSFLLATVKLIQPGRDQTL